MNTIIFFLNQIKLIIASLILLIATFGFFSEAFKLIDGKLDEKAISGLSLSLVFLHLGYKLFRVQFLKYQSHFKKLFITIFAYLFFYFGFFALFSTIEDKLYHPDKYNGGIDWALAFSFLGLGAYLIRNSKQIETEHFKNVEKILSEETIDKGSSIVCPGCSARNPGTAKKCIYCDTYL